MTDKTVSNLPGPTVHLDLEDYEYEPKEPFRFKLRGRILEMRDPEDLDWRDLLMMDDPVQFLRLALSEEDRTWLFEQDFKAPVLAKIMEGYNAHFGLDEKLASIRRNQRLRGNG